MIIPGNLPASLMACRTCGKTLPYQDFSPHNGCKTFKSSNLCFELIRSIFSECRQINNRITIIGMRKGIDEFANRCVYMLHENHNKYNRLCLLFFNREAALNKQRIAE